MSQELFYTSAPKGLKPGSHGYCTVAATSGMAPNVADKLESLSAYRHIFAAGSGQEAANPVVYSYLRLVAGGRTYFVLSRIADAGLDYTQRNNKFAHHVALDAAELPPAGPAWLLAQDNFLVRKWTGEPRIIPAGRKPPQGILALGICRAWEALTGDAGWAGVLAESATRATPVFLIIDPSTNILPLLVEAQSLLAPKQRWGVTLSTYYTKLPAGVECQWRCVLKGSPEAKGARTIPGSLIIDLTQKLGTAAGGVLVEAARSGLIVNQQLQDPAPTVSTTTNLSRRIPQLGKLANETFEYSLEQQSAGIAQARHGQSVQRQTWTRHPATLAAATLFLLLIGIAAGIGVVSLRSSTVAGSQPSKVAVTRPTTTVTENAAENPDEGTNRQSEKSVVVAPPAEKTPPETKAEVPSLTPSTTPAPPPIPSEPIDTKAADKPVNLPVPPIARELVLEAKYVVFDPFNGSPGQPVTVPARNFAFPIRDCELSIQTTVTGEARANLILIRTTDPNRWELAHEVTKSNGTGSNKKSIAATFTASAEGLAFRWQKVKSSPTSDVGLLLRDSVLTLGSVTGGRKQRVVFRMAIEQRPFVLSASVPEDKWKIEVAPPATREKLFCELIDSPYKSSFDTSANWRVYQVTDYCELKMREAAGDLQIQLCYDKRQVTLDELFVDRNIADDKLKEVDMHISNLKSQGTNPDPTLEKSRTDKLRANESLREETNLKHGALVKAIEALRWLNAEPGRPYRVYFNVGENTVNVATGTIRLLPSQVRK